MSNDHVECPECGHLNSPYRQICKHCRSPLPTYTPNPLGMVLNVVGMALNMFFKPETIVSLVSGLLGGALVFFLLRTMSVNSGDPDIVIALLSICPITAAVITIIFVYSWLDSR